MAKDMDSSNRMHHSNDALMDEAIARLEGIDSGRHRDTAKYKKVLEAIDELHRVSSPFYEKPIGNEDNLWDIRSAYKALVSACDEYTEGKGDKRQSEFGSQRLDSIRAIRDLALKDSALLLPDHPSYDPSMKLGDLLKEARSVTVSITNPEDISSIGANTSSRIPLEVDRGNGPQQGFFTEHKVTDTPDVIYDAITKKLEGNKTLAPLLEAINYGGNGAASALGIITNPNKQNPVFAQDSPATGFRKFFGRKKEETFTMTDGLSEFYDAVRSNSYVLPKEFSTKESFKKWVSSDPTILPALHELSKEVAHRVNSHKNNTTLGKIAIDTDIPSRNIGMSRMAEMLGLSSILAKSDKMTVEIGGELKTGVFMEKAEGTDIFHLTPSDPMVAMFNQFKMGVEPLETGSLKRDLANIQVLDYICGNPDRHLGNMIYQAGFTADGQPKVTGLVGIDNDLSFGELDFNGLHCIPQNFRIMTRETASMVMQMDRAFIQNAVADLDLTDKEFEAMVTRVGQLRSYIANPNNTFFYDSSKTPAEQLPFAKGKLIIVNDEKDLQVIPLEEMSVPPRDKDHKGNMFQQIQDLPDSVRKHTKEMYDGAMAKAVAEAAVYADEAGEYVDPVTKEHSYMADAVSNLHFKIVNALDKIPPIHFAKTVLRESKQASAVSSTPQDPQQSTPQADTGLSPDQKPLRFTPESVAAAQAFHQSTPQPAAQAPQQRDTGLSPDQKPLRFTPESVAAAKSFQKSTPQPTAQAPQQKATGLAPDQKPLRFTPESVAAAKESAKTGGPNEHTRTKIDLKTLESKTPKSEAALRAEALAVRKRSRSYAKPPVPQPSVKAAAAAIGK